MNSTYNVGIKIMGGTTVAAHTERGIKPTRESVSKILAALDEMKPTYNWSLIGDPLPWDSIELIYKSIIIKLVFLDSILSIPSLLSKHQ